VKRGQTPRKDLALLALAVALMVGGAVTLVGGWVNAGMTIPVIAVGIALVVIAQRDIRQHHVTHA
jgi:hypothetical protein